MTLSLASKRRLDRLRNRIRKHGCDDTMTDAIRQVDLLRAACCVAGADGAVSAAERRLLQRLADRAGVGTASMEAMIERAETDPNFHEEQFRVLKYDPKETMQLLFRVAVIDDELGKQEAGVLQRLAKRLEVSTEQFSLWLKQAVAYLKAKQADGNA